MTSYELREEFAEVAQRNVHQFFNAPDGSAHPAWDLRLGDLKVELPQLEGQVDRIILDMLDPWNCIDVVADKLVPGGIVCAYIATTTQLSRVVETLRAHGGFTEPHPWESLVRDWHVEGLAVRPDHKMIGHTAFLVTARRMAPGEKAPRKTRRPAPGAYGPDYTGPRPAGPPADGGRRRAGRVSIEVVPWSETWARDFELVAARLRQALGSIPGARVEHVGSTSVTGLGGEADPGHRRHRGPGRRVGGRRGAGRDRLRPSR